MVQLLVGALVLLLGLSAVSAVIARADVDSSTASLSSRLQPAITAANTLRRGFTDQAGGHLGYLMTGGSAFANRYEGGVATAAAAEANLRSLLPGDATVTYQLDALDRAAQQWRLTAIDPQRSQREHGVIPEAVLLADVQSTSLLYDAVRSDLLAVDTHTQTLQAAQVARIRHEQARANLVTYISVVLAVLLAAGGVIALRRALLRPGEALLRDIETVASGVHSQPISATGPTEFVVIADAVDRMRASILEHADDLAETKRKLAIADEHERFAADLHDRTVQRLFAVGLHLSATINRHPTLASDVDPLIDEADDIMRELRGVIFGLRRNDAPSDLSKDIIKLVQESSRSLGFEPSLILEGPIDDVDDALAVAVLSTLREALTNVVKHANARNASVVVSVVDGVLHLEVTDDGQGFAAKKNSTGYGLTNIADRAKCHGGVAAITGRPNRGTTVAWRVPCAIPQPA
ncbi:MAG TPA: CHASE3 domain-containing protein [Jatrophihabitantaceae bacterium]|nr:CHASE3 domain-containing protein [Jatrophihabitantaceae bacterium]